MCNLFCSTRENFEKGEWWLGRDDVCSACRNINSIKFVWFIRTCIYEYNVSSGRNVQNKIAMSSAVNFIHSVLSANLAHCCGCDLKLLLHVYVISYYYCIITTTTTIHLALQMVYLIGTQYILNTR
jgi:hypothetical protein